jgi:hypothetical protein
MAPRRKAPVNIATVADARARLAEIAAEHPEAFAPDRLPTTEARLRRALAVDPDPLAGFTVKLRGSTREALAARAKALGTQPAKLARELIERGLAEG